MQYNNHFLLRSLKDEYAPVVQKLCRNYDRLSSERGISDTLEQYIAKHLADAVESAETDFRKADQARRMSETAKLFSPETCSVLWKKRYPTGFPRLDDILGGGLTEGVHYIGAISSLGKSTLALQMADHMAAQSIPVVYVSLEMSREDLTAKLISMHTYLGSYKTGDGRAKTSNFLLSEAMRDLDEREWAAIHEARRVIETLGRHISIWADRSSTMTVDRIEDYMDRYVMTYEVHPVLIIDYLQILSSPKELRGCTDKQAVDFNVARFRAIADKYRIPVVVISSFNRDNYNNKVGLQAFKDSGNIEYSGDTMIGLQLTGVGEKDFNVDAAKAAYPRKVDLLVLKQRYGAAGVRIPFRFFTKFNYFEEEALEELSKKTPVPFEASHQRRVEGYTKTAATTEIVC